MKFLTVVAFFGFVNVAYVSAMNGDATYYNMNGGYTACGEKFTDDDLVAATAFSWWTTANPNVDPMCKKSARVTDPTTGKSVTVRIKDKCSACKREDIDLTPEAFKRLGRDLTVGRFKVQWEFV